MSEITTNGWNEYKQRIFFQLDQLTDQVEKINNKVDKLHEDVLVLKTKAWAFGIIGGGIVTVIFEIALKLFKL